MYETVGLKPYAFHATFQFAGTEGKRHRFRESQGIVSTPEYYDPQGILSFVSRIPEDILSGGNHTLETHFRLVNYQVQ